MNILNVISSQSTNQIRPSEIPRTANYPVSTAPDPLLHFPFVFFFFCECREQSRIRRHVCILFIAKRILYGALWRRQRGGKAQKWSFASAFIFWRRKRIYIRSAYCMKVQPLLVPMVPSISVNSAFLGALRPKSGCLSEKSGFFPFSEQSGANLASN